MSTHSFYDKDTGERVKFGGKRQSIRDSYSISDTSDIDARRDNLKAFTKAANLLGFEGQATDTYGEYLSGCGGFKQNGYCMAKIGCYPNGRIKSADPISPIFPSLNELQLWITSQPKDLTERDSEGEYICTEIGHKVFDFLATLETPEQEEQVILWMKTLSLGFEEHFQGWWDAAH